MVPRMGEESDTFSATQKPSRLRHGSAVPQTATQFRRFPTILVERATQTTLLHSLERFPLKQVVCATPFAEFSNFCIRLYLRVRGA